jgi:hypothetical protein
VFDTLTLSAVPDGSQIDVRVLAPRDLSAYAEQNRRRAASLLFGQDAEVVVTFVRPLSPEEFARLATLEQFTVRSIEAIGRERDGTILTIGGEPAMTAVLQEEYANRQASLEGIVAAYGTTNKAGFDVLSARSDVALVDVSPAFLRANLAPALPANLAPYSDRLDVLVNDVYWLLAGLE